MRFNIARMLRLLSVLTLINPQSVLAEQMSLDDTRHLLHRTGFAETPESVLATSSLTRRELIERLLDNPMPALTIDPPQWTRDPLRVQPRMAELDDQEKREKRQEINKQERTRIKELQAWWLENLAVTQNPLKAKLILFWQNHFTSEQRKVRHAQLMFNQLLLIDHHATGNFGELLKGMILDPAMLIYLDNRSNRKKNPNENFARELLELFTLGEGHYTEQDIKEAARALTGYAVNRKKISVFNKKHHDFGDKTILGNKSQHNAETLVQILLDQARTAELIVEKLWRRLISQNPDATKVAKLARIFRDGNYEMKPLLKAMLLSDDFWDSTNRGILIRSPADFIASTLRVTGIRNVDQKILLRSSRTMGQELFNPPNVKGWQEDKFWINSQTLLGRNSFIRMITRLPSQTVLKGPTDAMMQTDTKMQTDTIMPADTMTMPVENNMAGQDDSAKTTKSLPSVDYAHLTDAPEYLSDEQVRGSLLPSTVPPMKKADSKIKSRIGQFIIEPAWNLY